MIIIGENTSVIKKITEVKKGVKKCIIIKTIIMIKMDILNNKDIKNNNIQINNKGCLDYRGMKPQGDKAQVHV